MMLPEEGGAAVRAPGGAGGTSPPEPGGMSGGFLGEGCAGLEPDPE
jgi:hypothetical protein